MIQKTFSSSILLTALFTAHGAFAGMVSDNHGNVGYDTAAECDAAVNAGTAKFYKSYTHKPALLRAGEKRVQAMTLKDLAIPEGTAASMNYQAKDYTRGACDVGVGHKAGRDGVAPILQGKYVPYSPDMPVNVYLDKAGLPVRASMRQCDNWFGANMPRPVAAATVASKAVVTPTTTANVTPVAPVAPVAPAVKPAAVAAAMTTAQGAIGYREALGAAGIVAIGAILLHNHGDSGTTGSTGSIVGTGGTK